MIKWENKNYVEQFADGKYAAVYRNSGHRYMRTLMEGEKRVHTALLFANPLNVNE
jgi:hypothetical protein